MTNILIAGIGGASLGTEIVKCLTYVGGYRIFGCDISPFAYGHYMPEMEATRVVSIENYIEDVMDACAEFECSVVIPGGEEPLRLLNDDWKELFDDGVTLLANVPNLVRLCSNKLDLFRKLERVGITVPSCDDKVFPVIVKPATGSGGSTLTFICNDVRELASAYATVKDAGREPIVQEYIPDTEGEYTVCVLTGKDFDYSCVLRRLFTSKLSVKTSTEAGLISSGYTQGLIEDRPDISAQAERIARALGSDGVLNIQGRVRNGLFLPFEINARVSASCYLRTLARFNEVHMLACYKLGGVVPRKPRIQPGYLLRSFTETFVKKDSIKQKAPEWLSEKATFPFYVGKET